MQHREKLVGPLILTLSLGFLFAPALIKSEAPVFRDTGHFYYPSMKWEKEQWLSGEVPLWNQLENFGRPYLADGSSSVFYPGKILLFLPLKYVSIFTLYIALHFAIAAFGSYWCGKRISGSSHGGLIACISYTLGGCLLSLHCNLIYLVGASWLPWAISAAFTLHQLPTIRSSARFAVPLSLMTLGGDPQLALHVLIIYSLICLIAKDLLIDFEVTASSEIARRRPRLVSLLCVIPAVVLTAGLSAIQVLPSYEWTQEAERRSRVEPVSLWDLRHFPESDVSLLENGNIRTRASGLLGQPRPGTHGEKVYDFSIAPWQFAELIWPNVTGQLYPVPKRWTSRIQDDTRIWYPSIYAGLIPLVLAVCGLSFRRKRKQPLQRTLTLVLVFVMLASLGYFGIGWLTHQIHQLMTIGNPDNSGPSIGSQVGGLYWFLTLFIPGYSEFRYPGKWFIIASMQIALLAAVTFTRTRIQDSSGFQIVTKVVLIVSSVLFIATFAGQDKIQAWLEGSPVDLFLGPLSVDGAIADMRWGLLQAAIVSVAMLIALRFYKHRATIFMFILAADLLFANSWILRFADFESQESVSPVTPELLTAQSANESKPIHRISRSQLRRWMPDTWRETNSLERLSDSGIWERQVLKPRTHFQSGIGVLESETSIRNAHVQSVLNRLRHHGDRRTDGIAEPDPSALRQLGIEFMLISHHHLPSIGKAVEDVQMPSHSRLWQLPDPQKFAYSVSKATLLASIDVHRLDALLIRSEDVYYPEGLLRDFSTEVVIETLDERLPLHFDSADSLETAQEPSVQVEAATNNEIRLTVESDVPHYVVVNQLFHSGWHATAIGSAPPKIIDDVESNEITSDANQESESLEIPIHRANRIVQAMHIPAGNWEITMRYIPHSFELGRWISLCSMVLLFFVLTVRKERKRSS
tara:strand:+ start:2942 stop:5701 length:2760 start_codon:yes stop_codon:yes gene_type:complete